MVAREKLVAEFLGTFLLVFTVGCNILSNTPVWAGVSIACVLMVMIYSLGAVSGANFNPAVSLSLAITHSSMKGPGDMDWRTCGTYMCMQLLGGLVGAFSYAIMFWNAFTLGPTKGFGVISVALCEILYTFMLCFVVLNVAIAKRTEGNQWYGLAIGFVIIAGAYGAGVVSGGCFNPAVAFGIDTSSMGLGFGWCIAYTLFELIGAALAAVAFKAVRPGEFTVYAPEEASMQSKLIAEFLGTFMLVLTVGLNILGDSPAGAFSIAASLMCMIYALGDVSGAHFNPAVTLAIAASKTSRITPNEVGLYMLVQFAAGSCASFVYTFIYRGHTFPLGPMPEFNWWHVGIAEVVFTFLLCYVVLAVAVHERSKSTTMFALAIGSCVTVGGFAIGSISGGSLNPAVSFGVSCSRGLAGSFIDHLSKAMVYSLFEFIGAGLAAGVIGLTHGPNVKAVL